MGRGHCLFLNLNLGFKFYLHIKFYCTACPGFVAMPEVELEGRLGSWVNFRDRESGEGQGRSHVLFCRDSGSCSLNYFPCNSSSVW